MITFDEQEKPLTTSFKLPSVPAHKIIKTKSIESTFSGMTDIGHQLGFIQGEMSAKKQIEAQQTPMQQINDPTSLSSIFGRDPSQTAMKTETESKSNIGELEIETNDDPSQETTQFESIQPKIFTETQKPVEIRAGMEFEQIKSQNIPHFSETSKQIIEYIKKQNSQMFERNLKIFEKPITEQLSKLATKIEEAENQTAKTEAETKMSDYVEKLISKRAITKTNPETNKKTYAFETDDYIAEAKIIHKSEPKKTRSTSTPIKFAEKDEGKYKEIYEIIGQPKTHQALTTALGSFGMSKTAPFISKKISKHIIDVIIPQKK